nr:MAG TPA: hypothetical protein [Caudoviricetes sp.]
MPYICALLFLSFPLKLKGSILIKYHHAVVANFAHSCRKLRLICNLHIL